MTSDTKTTMAPPQQETYCREDLQALNLIDQPVWIFDIVRRGMWYANNAAVELWSASSLEDLLARDFASDMSESTKHRLDDYLLKFSSDENCVITEQWTFYPNGQGPKTVDCRFKGIMIEEGRLATIIQGTYKEFTSEAEQEALRSVEMLRHLPVSVCLTDLDGNVMEQNPEALAVFGSIDKTNNKDDSDDNNNKKEDEESAFVKRFVDKDLGKRILMEARTGKDVHRLEALQNTVHGPRWSAIQVRQTKDPVTSKPILLYSARDITAVVEAKRQAVAADSAKMDLLADMAHAIRTPLQHVVGVVELLSLEPKDQQKVVPHDSRYSNLLQSSAQLLMTVLNDLMDSVRTVNNNSSSTTYNGNGCNDTCDQSFDDYQQQQPSVKPPPSTNRIKLEHTLIDVQQVLDNAIAMITPHAEVKDLQIKSQVTSLLQSASLMGDASRLGQVLFEILHNAVKYTSRGGIAVTVRRLTKRRARRVRLRFEVKDTGVGLNLEQQRQCLEGKSLGREHDGSGNGSVGLELCKNLVWAMGGIIGVDSKPGRGSTFWFEVPFLQAVAATAPTTAGCTENMLKQRSQGSLLDPVIDDRPEDGGLQILLVDKEDVGRNVMTTLLEQSGHNVTTVDNGDAMIKAVVSQDPYDVVLLETQLCEAGGCDAFDAIREVRRLGFSPESLPILALTAAVPRADYPELGLNDWLTKPMLIKDIQKAMTNAICNVGCSNSTGTGSVFTSSDDTLSMEDGSTISLGYSCTRRRSSMGRSSGHSGLSMPRRGSFGSIQSTFSDHLKAVLGSNADEPPKDKAHTPSSPSNSAISAAAASSACSASGPLKSDKPPKPIRRSLLQQ